MQHLTKLIGSLLVTALAATAQTAPEVAQRVVDSTGGAGSWQKLKTLKTTGEYVYGGLAFPFRTFAKAPNHYRLEVPFKGKQYTQVFDGKAGWRLDGFKDETKPELLSGANARALANEADPELQPPLFDYRKKGHRLSLEADSTVDSHPCFRLKLTKKGGAVETYFVDKLSFLPLLKVARAKNPELDGDLLRTRFGEYRNVGGFKIPFSQESKIGEQTVLKITLDEAEVNYPVADSLFLLPR
ncbi:MAG: hypothetical protein H7Y12_14000 [Sphingobacteriaceae bacterium]|nr:hypothetical protein [Cytophagaceae bacterium]